MTKNDQLPTAEMRPERRFSLAWIVPLLALLVAGALMYTTWAARGTIITIQFAQGYGLEPGAAVRHRGITVGEVRELALDETNQNVVATVSLISNADSLARSGSRFWIVRPQLAIDEVEGLETLLGARYINVLPGDGRTQRSFVGVEQPPLVLEPNTGDLEILLRAPQRYGLRRGSPVMYRRMNIGRVLSVGLTSDAGAVESRLHIDQPFASLITPETRFWPITGVKADVGISGFTLELDSVQTLLSGGVALAVPPDSGEPVGAGHRFGLSPQPDDEWLEWQPQAVIGSALLPPGAAVPQPRRARLVWKQGAIGRFIQTERLRQGWLLPTEIGLLGPRDLLDPGRKAEEETVAIELGGRQFALTKDLRWANDVLAVANVGSDLSAWPATNLRAPNEPEDVAIISDPTAPPLPVAADRFTLADDTTRWNIDPAISLDETQHGAIIVARTDGRVIGVLLATDDDELQVAVIPTSMLSAE